MSIVTKFQSGAAAFVRSMLVAMIAIAGARQATAAPLTWSGPASGNATWTTGTTNWVAATGTPWGSTSGSTNVAVFNSASGTATVSGTVFTNGLTFSAAGGLVTGGTLTLAANAGTLPALTVATGTSTIATKITGTGFSKQGTGALVLSNTNTYSGTTTINNGSLLVNNSSAVGSGAILVNGTSATTAPRLLLNANGVNLANAVTVSGSHGTSGAGTVHYNVGSGTGTISGPLTFTTSATAGGALGTSGGTLVLSGTVTSSGGLLMRIGTTVFSGTGRYSLLEIGEGTIRLGAGNALSGTSRLNFQNVNGAANTFDLAGFSQTLTGLTRTGSTGTATVGNSSTTSDSTLTLTGSSSFSGTLQDAVGSGTKKLLLTITGGTHTLTGTSTYTGETLVSGGRLVLGNAVAIQNSPFNTASAGTLDASGLTALTLGGLNGSGAFAPAGYAGITALTLNTQPGNTATYGGNLADGAAGMTLMKSGSTLASTAVPGVQVLTGTSQYTGATSITGGVLQFAKPSALYGGDTAKWTAANLVTGSGGALGLNVGGPGEFTESDVSTLVALGSASTGFLPGSAIALDTTNAAGTFSYGSVLADPNGGSNPIGLVKLGGGALTLTAANTYTGITHVAGGSVGFSGAGDLAASAAGWFVSGSGATLDVGSAAGSAYTVGSLGVVAGGTLALGSKAVTFGAAGGGPVAGTLTGSGSLTYTGTSALALSSSNGYAGSIALGTGALVYLQNPYGLGDAVQGTTLADGARIYFLNSANSAPIPEPLTIASGTATLQSGNASAFTLAGPLALDATAAVSNDGSSSITVTGPITGAGGIVKTGANGTLTLTNTTSANTFSGGIVQSSTGGITIGAAGSQGTGDITFAAGGNANVTFSNVDGAVPNNIVGAGGTGGITKSGTGTTILSGTNTYTGTTTITANAGVLRIDAASALAPSSTLSIPKAGVNAGYLQLNTAGTNTYANAFANFGSANPPTIGGSPTIQNLQGDNTLSANMNVGSTGGSGIVVVSDGGLLTLSGTISNTAGTTRPLLVGGSGNGVVSGLVTAVSASSSGINKFGTGTWSVTNTGNTFTLAPQILDGVLDVANLANAGVASAIGSGTTIQFSGQNTSGTLRYTGATDQSTNRTLQIDPTGGAIDSSGVGVLTLSGSVSVVDLTTFNSQNITFTSGSNVAYNNSNTTPGTVVGQRFTSPGVSGTVTITAINGNAYTLSSSAILTGGTTVTFVGTTDRVLKLVGTNTGSNTIATTLANGTAGGRLGITKDGVGTWVLTGSNTYSGPTTVSGGRLVLGPAASIGSSGTVSVAAGAVLDVTQQVGGFSVTSGQTLAGSGTVTGGVVVGGGARVSPGASPGNLTVVGGLTFNPGGNYNWQMLDATGTAGGGWDLISTDTLSLAGLSSGSTFNVNLWSISSVNPDVNGPAANFDASLPGSWRILTSGATISGFDPSLFKINTLATAGANGFMNPLLGGTFSLALSNDSQGVDLVFTPATPYTWYGDGVAPGGSGTWTVSGSTWNDGSGMVAWDPSRNALFGTAGGTVTISGSLTAANGLNFAADGYTITGDALALTAGNKAANAINVAAGVTATIGNAVTAVDGFSKTGAGRLVVLGDIAAAGGASVTTGTLAVGNGGTAGTLTSDVAVSAGAVVVFDRADASTYSGTLTGGGTLVKRGGGLLTLTGSGAPTGGVSLVGGTLGLGSATALGTSGTISFLGGVLQATAANTADYSSRFSTGGLQAYAIDTNGQNVTWASGLTSAGGTLLKLGSGTLALSGSSTYLGDTTISGGALSLGAGGAGGSIAGNVVNNSELVFNRSNAVTFSGTISGTGMVRKLAANTLTIGGSSSYSGGTSLEVGLLQVNASGGLGSGTVTLTNVTGTTRLLLGGSTTLANAIVLSGQQNPGSSAGVIQATSGTATITGPVTLDNATSLAGGHFATAAGATLVFGGPVNVTGTLPFSIRQGNIVFSGTGSTGWTSMNVTGTMRNGATNALCTTATVGFGASGTAVYDLAGFDQTLAGLVVTANTGTIANSSTTNDSTLTIAGGTSAYSGQIVDSIFGGTRKMNLTVSSGSLGLTGATSFTGATRIAGGTLGLGGVNALAGSLLDMNAADTGSLVLSLSGSTFNVGGLTGSRGIDVGSSTLSVGGNGQSTTYDGVIVGTGGLTKAGTGTLVLTSTQAYTGPTGVGGGTLRATVANQFVTSSTLAFTGSNATFDIGATTQTLATLATPNGGVFDGMAVTGTGGALVLTGTAFEVGPGGSTAAGQRDVLSLSGLTSFTYANAAGAVRVGLKAGVSQTGQPGTSSLTLAQNNSITATTLGLGEIVGSNDGGGAQLFLGQSNALSVTNITMSNGRADALMQFANGLVGPTLVIRGTDATSPAGTWLVGSNGQFNSASRKNFVTTVDLSAGSVDAAVTSLTIGQGSAAGTNRGGSQTSSFTMGSGTLSATTITVGRIASSGTNGVSSTFSAYGTLSIGNPGAVVLANTLAIAENAFSGTGSSLKTVSGTVNLSAGTLLTGTLARGVQSGTTDVVVNTAFNWTGGTLGNLPGTDMVVDSLVLSLASGTGTFVASGTNWITVNAASVITGSGSLVKAGPGTVVLAGTSRYAGPTTVSAGTLLVNGDGSSLVGALAVNAGVLGGTGSIGGAITVNPGATLAPGASIGTLTTGSAVSFADGSTFGYELNTAALTADLLRTAGPLTLSGSVTLAATDLGGDALVPLGTVLSLINYGGSLDGGGLFTVGGTPLAEGDSFTLGQNSWQIAYSSTTPGVNVSAPLPSGSYINLTAVPEPTTWALVGSAAAIATLLRRRRSC